ncbi:hypothetical protein PtB15_11B700 [Puccinia triticina]|nr:hypothetical protein PtB15_11B700 [Puccinia triticina]
MRAVYTSGPYECNALFAYESRGAYSSFLLVFSAMSCYWPRSDTPCSLGSPATLVHFSSVTCLCLNINPFLFFCVLSSYII